MVFLILLFPFYLFLLCYHVMYPPFFSFHFPSCHRPCLSRPLLYSCQCKLFASLNPFLYSVSYLFSFCFIFNLSSSSSCFYLFLRTSSTGNFNFRPLFLPLSFILLFFRFLVVFPRFAFLPILSVFLYILYLPPPLFATLVFFSLFLLFPVSHTFYIPSNVNCICVTSSVTSLPPPLVLRLTCIPLFLVFLLLLIDFYHSSFPLSTFLFT